MERIGPQGFELEGEEADELEAGDALTAAIDVQLDNADLCLDAHKRELGAHTFPHQS